MNGSDEAGEEGCRSTALPPQTPHFLTLRFELLVVYKWHNQELQTGKVLSGIGQRSCELLQLTVRGHKFHHCGPVSNRVVLTQHRQHEGNYHKQYFHRAVWPLTATLPLRFDTESPLAMKALQCRLKRLW